MLKKILKRIKRRINFKVLLQKGFKFKLNPTIEQKRLIYITCRANEAFWNIKLTEHTQYYKDAGKYLIKSEKQYKEEYPWLKEVDSTSLQATTKYFDRAWKNFFNHLRPNIGKPIYKSKKSNEHSYTTYNNYNKKYNSYTINIVEDKFIKLPKIGKVRIKLHRRLPENFIITSVCVRITPAGVYEVSIQGKYEIEINQKKNLNLENSLGLDYSSEHFYVDSQGVKIDMPHYYRLSQKRLSKEQRKLSKKQKGSNNYYKQSKKKANFERHVKNQRLDFQHKLSRKLAIQYDFIFIEDIDLSVQKRQLHLGKSVSDNAFGQFKTLLDYKLKEQGKLGLTKVNRFFPSSQICNDCGYQNNHLRGLFGLKIREWICPECGCIHDRDINAAKNIRDEGIRSFIN